MGWMMTSWYCDAKAFTTNLFTIDKLKEDLRSRQGDHAVLVSVVLPTGGTRHFRNIDGIWVTEVSCAVALATALHCGLVATAALKVAAQGKNEKMETLYEYLCGTGFRARVEAVV